MSESREQKIERLLREGLDLYGVDEISQAMIAWRQVLELEPGNQAARDYMDSADRRKNRDMATGPTSQDPIAAAAPMAGAEAALLQQARGLLRAGDSSAALDLLQSASGTGLASLEFEAMLDVARSRLVRAYCERMGDLSRTPSVVDGGASSIKFNLPSNAGFLLSMVDGMTSIEDLISLSGMDAFDALHTMNHLMEAGLVEMPA
jgi:hypothetical protein